MSNGNNRNQIANVTQPNQATEEKQAVVSTKELNDPVKTAVSLCLSALLRASVYGTVPRSYEGDLKDAIESLK